MQLQEIFNKIFDTNEFQNAKNAPYSQQNPFYKLFDKDIPRSMKTIVDQLQYPLTIAYEYKGSIGAGVLADTFWFNVMNPRITQDPQRGVYIVYLVAPAGDCIYLCLIQSTGIIASQAQLERITPTLKRKSQKVKDALVESIEVQPLDGLDAFSFGSIDLGAQSSLTTQAYEAAVILSKKYEKIEGVPVEEVLQKDLKHMLSIYTRYYTLMQHGKV